MQLTLH